MILPPTHSFARRRKISGGRVALGLRATVATISLLVGAICLRLQAGDMTDNLGATKNFVVADYYNPPNQNQVKSLLRGGEARFRMNGRVVQISEVQVESYDTNGKLMYIARSPDCTFDRLTQSASSSNRVEAASADGRFYIQGEGFLLDQTNQVISISNQVYTRIWQEAVTNSAP